MNHIILLLKGVAIGIANIVPGLSAGTIAFMVRIYDKLTEAIGNIITNSSKRKEYIAFLSVVFGGAVIGILGFAKMFTYLLSYNISKQLTYFFIIGLIVGTIPFIFSLGENMKPTLKKLLLLFGALIFVVLISMTTRENQSSQNLFQIKTTYLSFINVTQFNLLNNLWLMLCGFLASSAMVLPGMSGSALLISLGEYSNVLKIVNERLLIEGIFFGLGIIPGIIIFSKIIRTLLNKYKSETLYIILGLFIASIFQIYVEIEENIIVNFNFLILCFVLLLCGMFLSYYFSRIKKSIMNQS